MTDTLGSPKETIEKLLVSMPQLGASDLHLKVGYAPYFRLTGHLRKVDMPPLPNSAFVVDMLRELVPPARREELDTAANLDFSARGATGDRYRVNVFRSAGEVHSAIRRVQSAIPTFGELHLPAVYEQVVAKSVEGLILISGITGAGKSSTLAAMIEYINQHRSTHIVTIEDPIEYSYQPKKSIVSQREIGIDVRDYAEALRYVVRQDPDVILIGELRDQETMLAALQAAETGHLVLGSLHCSDVPQTFSRILEFFPRPQHAFIRSSLANSLKAIMCQKLLEGIDKGTRFPATEVLLSSGIVKDKIVREEDQELNAIIATGVEDGMRSFTYSLCELIETEKVHYDTAMEMAPNRDGLDAAIKGISTSGQSLVGRSRS